MSYHLHNPNQSLSSRPRESNLAFRIGIILKGLNALVEIVGAFLALFASQASIHALAVLITRDELAEEPKDLVANFVLSAAQHFTISDQTFAFYYLLSHGVIKIILVAGMLRGKRWAYPAALVVFLLFILYQIFRFTYAPSLWLILLTVFDAIVWWLVWEEYGRLTLV